jgi:hypothetical protein
MNKIPLYDDIIEEKENRFLFSEDEITIHAVL